jgi:hypothetical protein
MPQDWVNELKGETPSSKVTKKPAPTKKADWADELREPVKKKEVSPSVSGGSTPVAGGSEQMLAGEKQEGTGISELAPQEYWRTPVKLTADQIDPKNQKTLLNRTAYNYAAKKDYAKSNELITQGLKADPEDPYLNRLAYFNAKKQNDPNLRSFLERAAQTNPEDPVILHDLGVFAFNEGKKEDAYAFAEKALAKVNPTTAEGKRASSSLLGILATIEGQEGGDPTPFLEKKVQFDDKIKEEDEKWYNNPNPINYILSNGVATSNTGMAIRSGLGDGSVSEEFNPYRNYTPSIAEEIGAGIISLLVDAPMFLVGGAAAGSVSKPLITRSVNAVMNKAYQKAIQRGLSKEATELLMKQTAAGALQAITGVSASMAESAGALSVYDATRDVLSQVVEEGKSWADIDYGQTLKRFGEGAALGMAVGAVGYGTNALLGATTNRLGRAATKATGFAAENAVFVGGGAMLEGKPLSEITGKDWLASAATLGILKGVGILKRSTNFSKEKVNKGEFNVELTPEELKAVGEPTTEDAINKLSDPAKREELLTNTEVPTSAKVKLVWATEGARPDNIPAPDRVDVKDNTVQTFDKGGNLLEKKDFDDNVEANAYATQAQAMINDRVADEKAASLTPVERAKVLEEVKSSGVDLKTVNDAKNQPPEERSQEGVQALKKFNETVNTVREETITKGGENAVSERTLPENGEQEHQQVSSRGETTEAGYRNRPAVGGEVKAEEKVTEKEVVTPPEQPGEPITLSEGITGRIDNGVARFFDTEGKELVPRSAKHRRAKKEYFDQLVLDNGKETSITEDLSPDEYLEKIATSSENPSEVFNTYITERERSDSERIGTKDWAISQAIGRFGVDPEQLRDVWKSADEKREVRFYLKQGGAKLDQIAQQASEVYRPESDAFDEITPQDVFDFMKNYPAGPQQYFGRTPLERSLAERFEMLTGIKLNKTTETGLLNKTLRTVDSGEWGDDVAGRMTDDALFAIDEGLTAKNVDALFGVVSEEEFNTIKQAIKITEKNEEQGIGTEAGGERPVSDVEVGAEGRGAEETKGELAKELDDQITAKRREITDTTNEKNLALEKIGGKQDLQLGVPSSGELGLGVERAVDREAMDRVAKPYDAKIAALEREVADLEQRRQSVGEGDLAQTDAFKEPPTVKGKFQSLADNIRSNKIQEGLGGTASAGVSDTKLWNDILEGMAVAVEKTGDIAQAIKDAITSMRSSKEYLELDDETRSKFEKKLGGVWDTVFPDFVKSTRDDVTKMLSEQYGNIEEKVFGSKTAKDEDFAQSNKTISGILSAPSKAQEATFGKLADVVSDKLASGMSKALASQNMATRNAAKLVNSIIKDIGKPEALVAKEAEFKGKSRERAAADAQKLTKILTGALGGNKESLEKLDQVLDPEWYENPIKYEDLAPHEQHVYDLIRSTYDYIHDLNFAMGKINVGTYLMNQGKYSARLYDSMEFPEDIQDAWERGNSSMFTGMYKGREEIDEWKKKHHIANPIHGVSKRLYQTLFNKAIYDYAKTINEKYPDVVSPTERKGFTKLGGGYGDLSNKFVRDDVVEGIKGFFYTNKTMSYLDDAFSSYNRWAPRKFFRNLFTVWNPGVQLGNHTGNIPFSMMLGISPMRFEYNFWNYARKEAKNYGSTYRYLLGKGLLRSDLTRGDLATAWENMAKELDKVVADPNMFQKLKAIPGKAYSANDDLAKLAAFKSLMDMGYKPEKAVQFIREAYQNFNRVGKAYDFASKTPGVGNMFARWGGDLLRIAKLGITRRPINLALGLGSLHLISYLASLWSGESDNERKIREERSGFPKIPLPNWLGGDIPLAIKTGQNELNLARFISPLYIYSTPEQDDVYQLFQKFLPIQVPVPSYTTNPSGKGAVWMSQFLKDPVMSPIVQTALNADWKGAPILDPNETIYKRSNLSSTDKAINALRFLGRAYVPYGAYGDDFIRALTDNPDYYGRTKTPGQVALRFIGWNSQQFKEDRYFRTLMNEGNMVDSRMKSLIESAKSVIKARDLGQITQAQYHRREAELLEEFAKQVSKMKAYKEKAEPYLSRKSMAELEQLSREYQMGKKK